MKIKVDQEEYEVVLEFPVIHSGWECDTKGYIVLKNQNYKLVLSSHGRLYFAKNKELEEKISEYKEVLLKSKEALSLIYSKKKSL